MKILRPTTTSSSKYCLDILQILLRYFSLRYYQILSENCHNVSQCHCNNIQILSMYCFNISKIFMKYLTKGRFQNKNKAFIGLGSCDNVQTERSIFEYANWSRLYIKRTGLSSWSVQLVRLAGPSSWSVKLVRPAGTSSWSG